MMSKHHIFLLVILLAAGCGQNSDSTKVEASTDSISNTIRSYDFSKLTSVDLPHLELILTRGAFHYDSFELSGNKLAFIPRETENTKVEFDFEEKHEVILEDSIALSIFHRLIKNSIFDMDPLYESSTSCNSKLEVHILMYDQKIKVKCEDFERGCPEIISSLEDNLINLLGKDLKRFKLPG